MPAALLFLNCEGADIRPQIKPRKIAVDPCLSCYNMDLDITQ